VQQASLFEEEEQQLSESSSEDKKTYKAGDTIEFD
jgi:hypothetical protein